MNWTHREFGCWSIEKKLGAGGFGFVYLWENSQTKQKIATKSINKLNLAADEEKKLRERWLQEYEYMRQIDTPHIVHIVDIDDQAFVKFLNDNHAWRPLPVLTMEYCNSGDLRAHLQKTSNLNGLCEFEVREILYALRQAIWHMHTKCHIKHRDLKPDNIVIHKNANGKKIYKLTDFGLARYIDDKTMLQSVVGTRNYLAPEIVNTAKYTETVDYWSTGVIAFEILCGVLPFIPHQILFNVIHQISKKADECIAITEDFQTPEKFHCHKEIFSESLVSNVFRNDIEVWLRLVLSNNYHTRGSGTTASSINEERKSIPRFYSDLDEILESRILTVFFLNSCTYLYYKVTADTTLKELGLKIKDDTGVQLDSQYFICPIHHPLKSDFRSCKALDFFVDDWRDTSDSSNPPVMLYVVDVQGSFKSLPPLKISEDIKFYTNKIHETDKIPNWLMQKLARNINFLLTNEQRHFNTFVRGLKEYAMSVEEEIVNFKNNLNNLIDATKVIKGCALNFNVMLQAAQLIPNRDDGLLKKWQAISSKSKQTMDGVFIEIEQKLNSRYLSALRRMKELAGTKIFDETIQKDTFGVTEFQRHFEDEHQNYKMDALLKSTQSCRECRNVVHGCLKNRESFFHMKSIQSTQINICNVHLEFRKIQDAVTTAHTWLRETDNRIKLYTKDFLHEWSQNLSNRALDASCNKKGLFQKDGGGALLPNQNRVLPKDLQTSMAAVSMECIDLETKKLLETSAKTLDLLIQELDITSNGIRSSTENIK